MDVTRQLRDPAGLLLACATAAAALLLQEGPLVAAATGLAVIAVRVGAGVWLERRGRRTPGPWYRPLTPAQARVAELIAEGLTSKQIAERLFVEESTVNKHIEHINEKLDFHHRAQIAAWVEKRRVKQVAPKT